MVWVFVFLLCTNTFSGCYNWPLMLLSFTLVITIVMYVEALINHSVIPLFVDRLPFTGDKLQKYTSDILTHAQCKIFYKGMYRDTHVCINGPGTACKVSQVITLRSNTLWRLFGVDFPTLFETTGARVYRGKNDVIPCLNKPLSHCS